MMLSKNETHEKLTELYAWVDTMKILLDTFTEQYSAAHNRDPFNYPCLDGGDFYEEQFQCWVESGCPDL